MKSEPILPHHLVTVWNPSYASDAMDEHLAVLIDCAGRAQAGQAEISHSSRATYGVSDNGRATGNCPGTNGYENGSNRFD